MVAVRLPWVRRKIVYVDWDDEFAGENSVVLLADKIARDVRCQESTLGFMVEEGTGSDRWLSGGEGDEEQFQVLRDVSLCMEKIYDSQESEPSNAETLCFATSESSDSEYLPGDSGEETTSFDVNLYMEKFYDSQESEPSEAETLSSATRESSGSEYLPGDSGEETTSFDDNSQEEDSVGSPAESAAVKTEQYSPPIRDDTYVINSNKQPSRNHVYKTSDTAQGSADRRHPASQLDAWKNAERQRTTYVDTRGTGRGKTHTDSSDMYGDSSDSDFNLREPNNNTLKSNLNYVPHHEKLTDNRKSQIPHLARKEHRHAENRRSSLTKAHNRLSEKLDGRNKHRRSQAKYSSMGDDYSASMETDARYDESMVARPGSKLSSAPSYQSPSSEDAGHRSKGQWEITGQYSDTDQEGEGQAELRFHEKPRKEMYASSPHKYNNGNGYVNGHNRRLSTEKQTGLQKKSQKHLHKQLFITENKMSDTKASPLNIYKTNNKLHGRRTTCDSQEPLTALPTDNAPHDSKFDKYSKKDSGISSLVEDTCHRRDSAVKNLTVKNLKTFNDSFTEETVMSISMNQSDLEQIENLEKVKQWLHSFQSNRSEELKSISDVESEESVVMLGRRRHWAACESSPMLTSDMHDKDESQAPIHASARHSGDKGRAPMHVSARHSDDKGRAPTHTPAMTEENKSRAPIHNSAKHGGGDSRKPVHKSALHGNDHGRRTPVHNPASHSGGDSRIPVHNPIMHSEHKARGIAQRQNSVEHGEEKSRIPVRDSGHKRHTSGHTDKVDASCQTLGTSPMQVQYSGRSPSMSTPSGQRRSPWHQQASTPRQDGGKAKEHRVIKKVARCLNKPAMMRNVYSSADPPMKLRMREDGYSRNNSANSGKRLAEESGFEPEWSRDEFSSVGLMPTPPKSRKINQDNRSQGHSMLASPYLSRNERSLGHAGYDERGSRSHPQQSRDQTTSGYPDGSIYVQIEDSYNVSNPDNARLSVSDPHSQSESHYERSHTCRDTGPRNSFEGLYRQYPEQGFYKQELEQHRQNVLSSEVEASPQRDFDRHEDRQSRDSLKGTPKAGRGLAQHSHSQRSLAQINDKLPERNANTQPQHANHRHLPHTYRSESGYSDLPVNRDERPQNIYRANLMQESIQDFDGRGSCNSPSSGEVYNFGRRSDAQANHARKKNSESQNVNRYGRETDQQYQYDEVDGAKAGSGNTSRSLEAETFRRKNDEYVPHKANMNNQMYVQSPRPRTENSAGMRTNNAGVYNENDVYNLPRQYSQSQRRHMNRSDDSSDHNIQSPRKDMCRNFAPNNNDGQFKRGVNIMQHDQVMLHNVYSPRETDKQAGKTQVMLQNVYSQRETDKHIGKMQTSHGSNRHSRDNNSSSERQEKHAPGHQGHETEQINPGFNSPHIQRNRVNNNSDDTFSPSGSMAKLRLNTPKCKKQLSYEQYQNMQYVGAEFDGNMDTVYSNRGDVEMTVNSRDTSLELRKLHRHNSGESLRRSGRYVENFSDKENEYVERERAGFISLDEISSVSGQVNVRYSKSPQETNKNRHGTISENSRERASGGGGEEVVTRDRISPRYKPDNGEGFSDHRARVSPREANQAYPLPGSARVVGDRGMDVRMDSFDSNGSERRRSNSQPHSRVDSANGRNSSMTDRDRVSPNSSGSKSQLLDFKSGNSHKVVTPTYREERTLTSTESSYDTSGYMADRSRSDAGRSSSNRTKEDMLVRAEQQNHVRKMDIVKKQPAKQSIMKSLFERNNGNNRNLATPVNFTEFAEGISSGGISEPVSKPKPSANEASGFTAFKVPFNKSPAQSVAKRSVTRNLPTVKTQPGYGDVMNSTMREASRRHLSEIRNRAGNFVHSTPINVRAPLMLNETISTIQESDETENVEKEEVVELI